MTHEVDGLCSRLFCGIELFEIFVGILVERFDTTFAAKTDQPAVVEGVHRIACSTHFIVRNNAGGQGVRLGQLGGFGLIFRSFDDLGCFWRRWLVFFGIPKVEGGKEKASEKDIWF